MKKIIIVNNNMKVGGVQKSLYNLLWTLEDRYDVTLYLFNRSGTYQLPPNVKVVQCSSLFRFLGMSQSECKGRPLELLKRGFLTVLCRLFSRATAIKLMLCSQKCLPEDYDCAIAYLQNGNIHNLYGGVQDFVLHRVKASKKVAFLHCDYARSGANDPRNNRVIAQFDVIAACSDGCRRVFAQTLTDLQDKCVTVRNCHRFEEIRALAKESPVCYTPGHSNVLIVTRLAHEKGIERAIRAAAYALKNGIAICLHIVGSGAMREQLQALAQELGIVENAVFYGEQSNPYRFMPNAQLLLMTSYYEAAPMVIEEAGALGLPVLTTQTTSSEEMVTQNGIGWVCENTQDAINNALIQILSDTEALGKFRSKLCSRCADNSAAMQQFEELLEE